MNMTITLNALVTLHFVTNEGLDLPLGNISQPQQNFVKWYFHCPYFLPQPRNKNLYLKIAASSI